MPEKETILSNISELPTVPLDKFNLEDGEIWEGNDLGAHFKVTRTHYPIPLNLDAYVLSVSGLMIGKEKVIDDFIAALGRPTIPPYDPLRNEVIFVAWEVR